MLKLLLLLTSLLFITGCSYEKVIDSNYFCEKLNLNCIKKNRRVSFKTSKGDFDVNLYGTHNPVTVNNFIKNIKKNIYKNKRFYKIIKFPQVQLIHSGVYSDNNYYNKENENLKSFRRNIPLEIKLKKEVEPKYR